MYKRQVLHRLVHCLGKRLEGYKLNAPPPLLNIPICNIFSHNNKSGLFQLCSEIRLNSLNSVNNFLVCFFLFISFIIPLCLFNIICWVALLGFCFSGKITRFSQQLLHVNIFVKITIQKSIVDINLVYGPCNINNM